MFKLPTCPYCHTVYRYKEVKKIYKNKSNKCYHCGNDFKTSRKKLIILFTALVVVSVALNVGQLYMTPSLNLLLLLATDTVMIIIAIILIPFFLSFKKIKRKKEEETQ